MNKKLLVVSILAVFMLVAISFSTAVSSDTTTDEQRESPLFRIRARRAINERLDELKETIKSKFIGERVFFLPFVWQKIRERYPFLMFTEYGTSAECHYITCAFTCGLTPTDCGYTCLVCLTFRVTCWNK